MTTKITKIDRPTCKLIRDAVMENLAEFCEEYGLKITTGNGSFDSEFFGFKMTVTPANVDLDRNDFEQWAQVYGVDPSDYGRELRVGRTGVFKLVGINTKAPKFPFLGERVSDGKKFKFTEKAVKVAIAQAKVVR